MYVCCTVDEELHATVLERVNKKQKNETGMILCGQRIVHIIVIVPPIEIIQRSCALAQKSRAQKVKPGRSKNATKVIGHTVCTHSKLHGYWYIFNFL